MAMPAPRKKPKVKVRRAWALRPVTRVKPSDKLYRRSRNKKSLRKELGLEPM